MIPRSAYGVDLRAPDAGSSSRIARIAVKVRCTNCAIAIMPQAKDTAVAARLWDVSAALTGVSFDQVAVAA